MSRNTTCVSTTQRHRCHTTCAFCKHAKCYSLIKGLPCWLALVIAALLGRDAAIISMGLHQGGTADTTTKISVVPGKPHLSVSNHRLEHHAGASFGLCASYQQESKAQQAEVQGCGNQAALPVSHPATECVYVCQQEEEEEERRGRVGVGERAAPAGDCPPSQGHDCFTKDGTPCLPLVETDMTHAKQARRARWCVVCLSSCTSHECTASLPRLASRRATHARGPLMAWLLLLGAALQEGSYGALNVLH